MDFERPMLTNSVQNTHFAPRSKDADEIALMAKVVLTNKLVLSRPSDRRAAIAINK